MIFRRFAIQREEWTNEDDADMRQLVQHPQWRIVLKLVHKRIDSLTEDLVNGRETRPQISELKDLILQLQNYADPR